MVSFCPRTCLRKGSCENTQNFAMFQLSLEAESQHKNQEEETMTLQGITGMFSGWWGTQEEAHVECQCTAIPPYMIKKLVENLSAMDKFKDSFIQNLSQSSVCQVPPSFDIEKLQKAMTPEYSATAKLDHLPDIYVLDAKHQEAEGAIVKPEDYDKDAKRVVGHTQTVAEFILEVEGRDSIDDKHMPLGNTIHFKKGYDNAFWTDIKQLNIHHMFFGDGDQLIHKVMKIFKCFTHCLDVQGHEMHHGIVARTAKFPYTRQSGALNEHFADVGGLMVKQWKNKESIQFADWTIGEGLLYPQDGKTYALRSFKAPGTAYVDHPLLGTDPQPATMDGYKELPLSDDNGGVHLYSGIPNHAFYLFALGMSQEMYELYAYEKPYAIWYQALLLVEDGNIGFKEWAEITIKAVDKVYPEDTEKAEKAKDLLRKAWVQVKVLS